VKQLHDAYESGKRSDRPQLAAALADCKKLKAKLVVRAGYYEAPTQLRINSNQMPI
jgi:hypothetical protein